MTIVRRSPSNEAENGSELPGRNGVDGVGGKGTDDGDGVGIGADNGVAESASKGAGIESNPPAPLGAVSKVSEDGEWVGTGGSSRIDSTGLIDSTIDS